MPRKLINFELDFMKKDIFPRFTVKQFDDVSFNIKPKNQGLDYDTTGMTGKIFVGVNNDMFMQTTGITVSSNNINVLLDKNMLQNRGRAYAEIELTDSNGTITSSSFIFNIDEKIGEGAKIPGEYEGFVAKYERLISEFKSQVNSTINNCNTNVNSAIKQCNTNVDNKLNTVDSLINVKISDFEKRFNTLTSSQQQDAEVIDARDGEVSLKARLDRDIEKAKQVYVELEGSYISTESSTGAIQDLEILGNTVQDPNNLADIKSVGELQEDGTYKMSILSCGKNLFDKTKCVKGVIGANGVISTNNEWNVSDFIKVSPDMQLVKTTLADICAFDINKNPIGIIANETTIFTIPANCYYIRCNVDNVSLNTYQLEEGTQTTPYEPYQGNKCDILLPCQLEKVGDVADRLYYDDVEKAWCIEKQVTTYTITSDEAWQNGGIKNGLYSSWCDNIINNRISSGRICYTSVKYVNTTEEYNSSEEPCCLLYTNGVNIKVDATDLTSFKNKVKGMKLTYLAKTPQKIVLPLSTQIALNSFFGTTHIYMESGEVEGTIKCKIPKSLGATVQSLNNKTDILSDRIEAIEGLKDSQNMKYETDKGYLVCKETKNGVIDDLKIEGKTLVNLCLKKDFTVTGNGNSNVFDTAMLNKSLTNGNIYTIIAKVPSDILSSECQFTIYDANGNGKGIIFTGQEMLSNKGSIITKTFVPNANYDTSATNIRLFATAHTTDTFSLKDVILLEGDHTQNPPSYFEGLMSVGQDVDKIEVLSSNNLLEEEENYKQDKKQILFYNENGELEPIQELHEWDSIEKHSDNKWYYHKRSGKRSYQAEDENNSSYITDMTNTVYQLAEEEVYELAPLHLDSYANETLILCNSGAISPKMEFSITSHINELVKSQGERINLLEEKVYQYMVTQNRMQLASTYSADSVTFKVDYFSLCGDEENYDEDLYNLILNNILVGKDNYNYDKMFTMILDYASWNQISWEQFDILVGLMDMQHNPPVEELPTEDGIEDIIENEETPVE